jgi:hypothetical protein
MGFHTPNDREQAFLRIVTIGYPELQAQIESCEVDDYDPDGYCDVRVISGPPLSIKEQCEGPSLLDEPTLPEVDVILWISNVGFLDSVELVGYGSPLRDIYERFIDAAKVSKLRYKYPGSLQ